MNELKGMSYQDDKRAALLEHGYISYEKFLRDKYDSGLSAREVGNLIDMSKMGILNAMNHFGIKRRPVGGRNNTAIPQWGIEELATYDKLPAELRDEYACMFLCSPVTVRLCHKRVREERGLC